MPLIDMKDLLMHAYEHGYAVGAFDLTDLDFLPAVLAAAESARAPVILTVTESRFRGPVFEWVMAAVEVAAEQAAVPVAIEIHGGRDSDSVTRGVRLGAHGIVASAFQESLFRHIDRTRAVVDVAHACGVPVEGELAYVPDGDAAQDQTPRHAPHTTVAEAKGFVERTKVDFLAVSVAMAHGHAGSRADWARLKEINAALAMPLGVYGEATLGDEPCRRLIMLGVAKIRCALVPGAIAGERLRTNVRRDRRARYEDLKEGIDEAIIAQLEPRMRVWGSAGRAAEVQSRCRPWSNIMHVLMFDAPRLAAPALAALIEEGRQVLSGIPGVRTVQAADMVTEGGRYRHCMLTRLASAVAAEGLHRHPAYTAFMDRRLMPAAADCIAGDYQVSSAITKTTAPGALPQALHPAPAAKR
ncbi:class II fructose-bisphosphate aldolase [Acidiferrobacter sp.]|uniref:class II fructose-bisphosphate aldolase n=1 Tax=Acidiferrobacter sp. TaxID=1872107 RepID=UPI0026167A71|nr:class II fructose-bisphosphate aldolase [Acidiferrobacter sp.]